MVRFEPTNGPRKQLVRGCSFTPKGASPSPRLNIDEMTSIASATPSQKEKEVKIEADLVLPANEPRKRGGSGSCPTATLQK